MAAKSAIKTKRIAYRIYEFSHKGVVYQIDGQNHECDTREWELFVLVDGQPQWYETYPTKKAALEDITAR